VLEDEHWQQWRKHLDVFQARREFRRRDPTSVVHRLGRGSRTQQAFAEFAAIRGGKVLDLGCGPGRFRWHLDADRVEYYGLDPIPLPEAGAFRFVRALAEHIPFKTHVFSHVVVLSAMDHFLDLEAVFKEIHRVLRPDGRVHVLQSVHDVRRPVKLISHLVKDFVEDFLTARKKAAAPHHMTEFSLASLCGTLGSHFALERQERYSRAWYSPDKVFTSSAVLQDQT
jgi:ubiquinone/menaquinone biosynthesis C-methylase UbiE